MNDTQGRHNAILENRQRLQLSGVTDVDSFDEDEIRQTLVEAKQMLAEPQRILAESKL